MYHRIILLSCLFSLCFGSALSPSRLLDDPSFLPSERIVGGTDTDIRQVPYQVSLETPQIQMCGGSIISDTHVLTAAHCVSNPKDTFTVRVGTSQRKREGTVYEVKKVHSHPKYDINTMDYDIAVLEVNERIRFDERTKPIPLVKSEATSGASLLLSGWGRLEEGGKPPQMLQSVRVPVLSRKECQDMYYPFEMKITQRMICGFEPGKGACKGDSGGPAVVDGHLAGVTSFTVGCATPDYPSVYTNVADPEIRDFIRRHASV